MNNSVPKKFKINNLVYSLDGEITNTEIHFKEKKIIIVREIKKLKSEKARNELYHYIKNPNYNIVLILISDMYDMKNTFLKKISTLSQLMDFRPPFENEMKQWISYVLQYKKIKVKAAILEEYIQLYGDSIAHVKMLLTRPRRGSRSALSGSCQTRWWQYMSCYPHG